MPQATWYIRCKTSNSFCQIVGAVRRGGRASIMSEASRDLAAPRRRPPVDWQPKPAAFGSYSGWAGVNVDSKFAV